MKQFLIKILVMTLLVSITFIPVVMYNVNVDPYGVFKKDFSNQKVEPNQRFIKMKMLLSKQVVKDSFIFGSSRVGKINPGTNLFIKDYYNMTYSEGIPSEHLEDIKVLVKNGIEIKSIILALDNISYLVDPKEHSKQLLRLAYPKDKLSLYLTYFKYLTAIPSPGIYNTIKNTKDPVVFYDFYNTGVPIISGIDKQIEDNKDEHNNSNIFNIPTWESYYKDRTNKTIREVREIKDICISNNINLIVIINPMHQATYKKQDANVYLNFLNELAKVTDYYNFAGINQVTTNNYYYYETSHYRPIVGEFIIDRIFGNNSSIDFGTYVPYQGDSNAL